MKNRLNPNLNTTIALLPLYCSDTWDIYLCLILDFFLTILKNKDYLFMFSNTKIHFIKSCHGLCFVHRTSYVEISTPVSLNECNCILI